MYVKSDERGGQLREPLHQSNYRKTPDSITYGQTFNKRG